MNRPTSFPTSVCSEYETLLHRCKGYMDACRKASEEISSKGEDEIRRKEIVERLVEQYERSYARLVYHFDHCRRCQMARAPRRRVLVAAGDDSLQST